MMHSPDLTAPIFILSCLVFVIGLDCTNRCYYYSAVPKNVTTVYCNPEGRSIEWTCEVYSPHCDYANISVQWYKAMTDTVASHTAAEGVLLSEIRGKYTFSMNQATSAVNDSLNVTNELFLNTFTLTIHNFNSSIDDGNYWCQIMINDSCPLQPSSIGYIHLSCYPTRMCAYNMYDFIEYEVPLVCAEGTPCMGKISTEQQTTMVYGEITTKTNSAYLSLGQSIILMSLILYGVIGGLLFIIILLLLVIIGCTVCNVRNHKMITAMRANKAKYHPGQSLNVYDNQPNKTDDDVFAMDAPEAKETSDRKSDCRKQPILPPSKCAPLTAQEPTTPTMHASTSRNDEVKYARPGAMHRPPLTPQGGSSSSQYQGLRASGVDAIAAYNVPHVRRHEYSGGEVKADPKYANLPMSQ